MRPGPLVWLALAAVAGGVVMLVVGGDDLSPTSQVLALLTALAGWVSLLNAAILGRHFSRRLILAVGAALVGVCVGFAPVGSKDVGSYAVYGRLLAGHGLSPYTNTPADIVTDPWYDEVSERWRRTSSVYGPAFTGLSAIGMKAAGTNKTAGRLFFQGLAGLAVLIAAALVADRTKDAAATAFVALNPVILASVVNGGHNDALVGVGVLAGALLVEKRRWAWAGVAVAMAAMVKVAAILALPALAWWALRRASPRAAVRVLVTGGVALLLGYAVAGGIDAIRPLFEAGSEQTRSSIWRPLVRPLTEWLGDETGGRLIGLTAVLVGVALGALLVASRVRLRPAAMTGAAALCGYLLVGGYVLPWYWAWVLLPLGLAWRTRLAVFAAAMAALLLMGYVWQPGDTGFAAAVLHAISHWAVPAAALLTAGVLAYGALADLRKVRSEF